MYFEFRKSQPVHFQSLNVEYVGEYDEVQKLYEIHQRGGVCVFIRRLGGHSSKKGYAFITIGV